MAIKTITIILGIFFFVQVILRIIKKILSFPIPLYGGYLLDHGLRKRLQPPNGVINRSGIKKGMRVLEVGCGTGAMTISAARVVGEKGKVYALDINAKFLKRFEKKLRRAENRDIN